MSHQRVEGPVDGRQRNVRVFAPHGRADGVGGGVLGRPEQCPDDRQALRGNGQTALPAARCELRDAAAGVIRTPPFVH